MPGAGIGLFQVASRGGAAAFSPLSLFASDEQGAWYDPSDLTTLFQDEAGTVPVTADSQPVRLILDKSGRNNHATAPSDAARPLYRTAGGLHWLEFDGVDDFFDIPVGMLRTATGVVSAFAANPTRIATDEAILSLSTSVNAARALLVHGPFTESNRFGGRTADADAFISVSNAWSAGNARVSFGSMNLVTGRIALYENGALEAENDSYHTGSFVDIDSLLARVGSQSIIKYYQGALYGFILSAAPSESSGPAVSGYLASKSGVTIA